MKFPERTELFTIPASTSEPVIGWKTYENVGVGVINTWILVPKRLRWVRELGNWTSFLGFRFDPSFNFDCQFCGWKLRFVNPVPWYLSVFKKSKMEKL